ncbi:MAG: YhfC family intramembrane metalloprotease [Oscillospiraceae bacterium]|nr:YhfC family intramembrane metalloprotease [Oscillospiraceae bacterium]
MEQIHFSSSTIAGYAVSGICMMLLAVILVIVWQKRTHAPLLPLIAGAVVFPVFALVLKQPLAYLLLTADNSVSRTINRNPYLMYLTGGLMAGILEETGRLIAFLLLKKKFTARETAISYGIGHGGSEAVYISINMLSYIVMALLVNSGNIAEITKDLPPEQLPAAMEQISQFASQSFGTSMLGVTERFSALMLQIGLSVLVFGAVYDSRKFWLYPLAMLLHTAADFSIVLFKDQVLLTECLLFVLGAAVLVTAVRFVYLPYREKEGSA